MQLISTSISHFSVQYHSIPFLRLTSTPTYPSPPPNHPTPNFSFNLPLQLFLLIFPSNCIFLNPCPFNFSLSPLIISLPFPPPFQHFSYTHSNFLLKKIIAHIKYKCPDKGITKNNTSFFVTNNFSEFFNVKK